MSVLLKTAVEWELIKQLPCASLLPVERQDAAFHDFDAYERLLEAAHSIDWRTYVIALLGGGGLRVGEIVALEWRHRPRTAADRRSRLGLARPLSVAPSKN